MLQQPYEYVFFVPSPVLTPEQVVMMQLDALQNNDLMPQNAGIRAAYNFASPANRSQTGTVDRFIQLVKNPVYKDMIGFEMAQLGPVVYDADQAQMAVRLLKKNQDAIFVFVISKQVEAPFTNCWMTDAVIRL
jgi:hypothetical protein